MSKSIWYVIAATTLCMPAMAQGEPKLELVNALIESMPQEWRSETIDQEEKANLEKLNPNKKPIIVEILLGHSKCSTPVINKFTLRLMQNVALSLSEEQIKSLTEFYKGPEYTRFAQLSDKSDSGQTLSDAEIQYMAEMIANYPMTEFYNAMQEQQKNVGNDKEFIAEITRCSLEKKAALTKAKIAFR